VTVAGTNKMALKNRHKVWRTGSRIAVASLHYFPSLRVYKPFIRSFQSNDRRCLQFPIIHHDGKHAV